MVTTKMVRITTVAGVVFAIMALGAVISRSSPKGTPDAAHYMPEYTASGEMILPPNKFEPTTETVHSGDIVEWQNDDILPYTSTAHNAEEKPGFDSRGDQDGRRMALCRPEQRHVRLYLLTPPKK